MAHRYIMQGQNGVQRVYMSMHLAIALILFPLYFIQNKE